MISTLITPFSIAMTGPFLSGDTPFVCALCKGGFEGLGAV